MNMPRESGHVKLKYDPGAPSWCCELLWQRIPRPYLVDEEDGLEDRTIHRLGGS